MGRELLRDAPQSPANHTAFEGEFGEYRDYHSHLLSSTIIYLIQL